jgi:hypothetical protein
MESDICGRGLKTIIARANKVITRANRIIAIAYYFTPFLIALLSSCSLTKGIAEIYP